ncbi:MAG: DNA primase [Synergistaceae bacterium]|jgi:DNA primase|nr:DNA primase [Synergistaceae bacterium]
MADDAREVKSRIDIADVVGDYVPLRRAGSSLRGLCPFHAEKTPSFYVSPDRQTFHCFGCGKGGDVFTFIMEMESLSFRESLERLAERAGVKLSSPGERRATRGDSRLILDEADLFFRGALQGSGGEAARAYLARRNLSTDSWARFGLGWASQSWDALAKRLRVSGYPDENIKASGLVSESEKGGFYDRFRGRVMFPIRDETARITGFGGRLIDGDGAKYINSPESELFKKGKQLYLLHDAKKTIKEGKRAILTEGYLDAMRAHLSGFTETVASLGTSLTEEQATLLKRFTNLCYISYDADGAGREASIRGMYILQRRGVEVRVISLPEGRDPDDLLSEEGGAEVFESLLQKALPLPLYHVQIRRDALRSPQLRKTATEDVLSGLASLQPLDLQPYIPRIARSFGLLEHKFEREIERFRNTRESKSAIYAKGISKDESVYIDRGENIDGDIASRTIDLECAICSLVWSDEGLRSTIELSDIVPLFSDEAVVGVVTALVSGESPDALELRWREMGERNCPARISRGDAVLSEGMLGPEHAAKLIGDLRERSMKRRYEALKQKCLYGEATREEIAEYGGIAKRLKGSPQDVTAD